MVQDVQGEFRPHLHDRRLAGDVPPPAEELAAKVEDGIAKHRRYAADPFVPELANGTTLHLILCQFNGTELVRLEAIAR